MEPTIPPVVDEPIEIVSDSESENLHQKTEILTYKTNHSLTKDGKKEVSKEIWSKLFSCCGGLSIPMVALLFLLVFSCIMIGIDPKNINYYLYLVLYIVGVFSGQVKSFASKKKSKSSS